MTATHGKCRIICQSAWHSREVERRTVSRTAALCASVTFQTSSPRRTRCRGPRQADLARTPNAAVMQHAESAMQQCSAYSAAAAPSAVPHAWPRLVFPGESAPAPPRRCSCLPPAQHDMGAMRAPPPVTTRATAPRAALWAAAPLVRPRPRGALPCRLEGGWPRGWRSSTVARCTALRVASREAGGPQWQCCESLLQILRVLRCRRVPGFAWCLMSTVVPLLI